MVVLYKQTGKSRTIKNIELEFDFTEVNISKTFILIHMLYREADNESDYPQPIPASDNKIPPYLQQFLPLFMVRFPPHNPKCPIDLFEQNEAHELVGEGHFGKREGFVRPFHYLFA
jgi:hypothetical protein